MRKVKLNLADLEVESFEVPATEWLRGTVQARATLGETGCDECNSGYTDNRCGECYSAGAGITCGCQSYEGCTQDPLATECYSDHHPTECGHSCFHPTHCNC